MVWYVVETNLCVCAYMGTCLHTQVTWYKPKNRGMDVNKSIYVSEYNTEKNNWKLCQMKKEEPIPFSYITNMDQKDIEL